VQPVAFDGAGTFLRLYSWVMDATNNVKIRADRHDDEDNNFAAGLSNCITKDGQTSITQNIPWNSRRIVSLADPIDPQDAATKDYADTKVSSTGNGTITGNLTVTGDLDVGGNVSAHGYKTRKGTAGPYGTNFFNFDWNASNVDAWIDTTKVGTLATRTYTDAQDASLQTQINTKQAALGFTPVQQGGGTGMGANKLYLGWDGSGIRFQVDNNDTMGYLVRSPSPTISTAGLVSDTRLAQAGTVAVATGPSGPVYEPYSGAVMTGWTWTIVSGVSTAGAFNLRYLQIKTTGGFFTVAYV
jgi:hypothetical protein